MMPQLRDEPEHEPTDLCVCQHEYHEGECPEPMPPPLTCCGCDEYCPDPEVTAILRNSDARPR